jgi:hypothetical protein
MKKLKILRKKKIYSKMKNDRDEISGYAKIRRKLE